MFQHQENSVAEVDVLACTYEQHTHEENQRQFQMQMDHDQAGYGHLDPGMQVSWPQYTAMPFWFEGQHDEAMYQSYVFDQAQLIEQAQAQAQERALYEGQMQPDLLTSSAGSHRRRRQAPLPRSSKPTMSPTQYTPAELLQGLQSDADSQHEAIAAIYGSVVRLSFHATGCRVVQLALEVADLDVSSQLAAELRGHVVEAIQSLHGNYVIQKIIWVMPSFHASFIMEELSGNAGKVARHRFGCRVFCRIVEHYSGGQATGLIEELLAEVGELCRHGFAHHVMDCILKHGLQSQQQQIVQSLCTDLPTNVHNRYSSFVLETALSYCGPHELNILLEALFACTPDVLTYVQRARLWSHIIRASNKHQGKVKGLGDDKLPAAMSSKHGRRLQRDVFLSPTSASERSSQQAVLND